MDLLLLTMDVPSVWALMKPGHSRIQACRGVSFQNWAGSSNSVRLGVFDAVYTLSNNTREVGNGTPGDTAKRMDVYIIRAHPQDYLHENHQEKNVLGNSFVYQTPMKRMVFTLFPGNN